MAGAGDRKLGVLVPQAQPLAGGDEGAQAFAASERLGGLRVLSLALNSLGDEGALALAASPTLADLTGLELRGNRLGKQAQEALTARFGSRVRLKDWKVPRGQPEP